MLPLDQHNCSEKFFLIHRTVGLWNRISFCHKTKGIVGPVDSDNSVDDKSIRLRNEDDVADAEVESVPFLYGKQVPGPDGGEHAGTVRLQTYASTRAQDVGGKAMPWVWASLGGH